MTSKFQEKAEEVVEQAHLILNGTPMSLFLRRTKVRNERVPVVPSHSAESRATLKEFIEFKKLLEEVEEGMAEENKGYADTQSLTAKKDYGKGPKKNTKETNKKE